MIDQHPVHNNPSFPEKTAMQNMARMSQMPNIVINLNFGSLMHEAKEHEIKRKSLLESV